MDTTLQNKPYEYFAFISYKREDEKWAKWLQKKLESYSLPTALRKENPQLPAKIRPVFRDQSELSGGNLKAEIEKGLNSSKYLIVICSPRSAKSPWVSKEVQHFIDNGKENFIIPFIIGGIPNASKAEDECFPEGLRQLDGEKEILGININEMGREAAAIKVIARMFDLRFDSLWQRFERNKRQRRIFAGIIASVIILLSLTIIGYISHQNSLLIEANNTIIAEQDKTKQANSELLLANDSIQKSYKLLQQLTSDLNRVNQDLNISNDLLIAEQQKLRTSNFNMKVQYYKNIIGNCSRLIEEDDLLIAARLLLNLNISDDMLSYIPTYESTLRLLHYKLSNPMAHKVSNIGNDIGDQREGAYFNPFSDLHISHKNDKCLIVQDDVINVYSTQTGALLWTETPGPNIYNTIFSNDDNNIIASDGEGNVYIYDISQDLLVKKLHLHDSIIEDLIVSKDNHIFSCADSIIKEFDDNGNVIKEYLGDFIFRNLKLTKDENQILVSGQKGCLVFSTSTGEIVATLPHNDWARFGNNNSLGLVTYSDDGTVKVWDNNWNLIKTHYFDSWIKDAYFLNETNLIVRDDTGIWRQHVLLNNREQIDTDITHFATQGNDLLLLIDRDDYMSMWNTNNKLSFNISKQGLLYNIDGNDDFSIVALATEFGSPSLYWNKYNYSLPRKIGNLCYNDNDFIITQKNSIPHITIVNDSIFMPIDGKYKNACNPQISQDQRNLLVSTYGNDSVVWIFDYPDGILRHTLKHNYYVDKSSFIAQGLNVATISNDSLWIWDANSGKLINSLGLESDINEFSFNREGICDFCEIEDNSRIYVATKKGQLLVWDYCNNTIVYNKQLQTHRMCLLPLHHKQSIITYSWFNDSFFNYVDKFGKSTRIETPHHLPILKMCLSRDEKYIATISDVGDIIIFELSNFKPIKTIITGYRNPGKISFDNTGRYLMTATWQGIVSLYDLRNDREIYKVDNYDSKYGLPVFSYHNELVLLDGGVYRPIQIEDIKEIRERIRSFIGDCKLSKQECDKWGIINLNL